MANPKEKLPLTVEEQLVEANKQVGELTKFNENLIKNNDSLVKDNNSLLEQLTNANDKLTEANQNGAVVIGERDALRTQLNEANDTIIDLKQQYSNVMTATKNAVMEPVGSLDGEQYWIGIKGKFSFENKLVTAADVLADEELLRRMVERGVGVIVKIEKEN
mgnify:CR=1 FL=1